MSSGYGGLATLPHEQTKFACVVSGGDGVGGDNVGDSGSSGDRGGNYVNGGGDDGDCDSGGGGDGWW